MNKKLIISGAIAAAATLGALGGSTLNAIQTFAATDTPTTTAETAAPSVQGQPQGGQMDPSKGGHVGQNGVKEELLTGDTAEKVKAAALKAVPGGTIERVETDAEGAIYEAHMTKSDGARVTVKLDASFNVTNTESGPQGQGSRAN